MDVVKLYPQYNLTQERRKQNPDTPVSFERRSGVERRNEDRIKLDTNLTRDIFEIKSKVSQIPLIGNPIGGKQIEQTPQVNKVENTTNHIQNASKAAQNEIKTDQFIKTTKPDSQQSPSFEAKPKSDTGALAGVFASILGGVLASTMIGVAGIAVAIGIGGYFGGKFLKSAIVSHIKGRK